MIERSKQHVFNLFAQVVINAAVEAAVYGGGTSADTVWDSTIAIASGLLA